MVDTQVSATHQGAGIVDQPYQIVGIRPRTGTIRELWLKRLGARLEYVSANTFSCRIATATYAERSYSSANGARGGLISLLGIRRPIASRSHGGVLFEPHRQ